MWEKFAIKVQSNLKVPTPRVAVAIKWSTNFNKWYIFGKVGCLFQSYLSTFLFKGTGNTRFAESDLWKKYEILQLSTSDFVKLDKGTVPNKSIQLGKNPKIKINVWGTIMWNPRVSRQMTSSFGSS